ncbi:DUF58 domain-containing protein [Rubritalea tangerina]|uniref:DUF58 domain-containing protein n=1 Tax=Rubritalea tangerina TaxID=430798 RepID=A0ABW4ZA64_9BACT
MRRRVQNRLYRLYRFGSKASFELGQRITPFGWMVIIGCPFIGFVTAMYPRDTLFRLLAIYFAVIGVALIGAWLRRAKIRVRRYLPRYATVGERLEYTVRYENLTRFVLRNFYLNELAPDPIPSRELFLHSTEPGEELRNTFDQTFVAYRWMWMIRRRLLLKSEAVLAEPVGGKMSGTVRVSFLPIRRGVIQLERMRVVLPDPLGCFQRSWRVEQEKDTVIVLPKRYRFAGFQIDGESRSQLGGDSSSSVAGQSGEFVSLREYRPGDPPKHIHWPSWGKTGKPIIKEYEDVFFPRYGLVLDTVVKAEMERVFEEAISIAATFASSVDTEQSLLDLMFVQQGAQVHTVGKNVERVDKMLEVLAGLDMETSPEWDELVKMVLKHAEAMTTCIVVLCSLDEERVEFLERLAASGVSLSVLLVVDEGAEGHGGESAGSVRVTRVSVHQVEAGLEQLSGARSS